MPPTDVGLTTIVTAEFTGAQGAVVTVKVYVVVPTGGVTVITPGAVVEEA